MRWRKAPPNRRHRWVALSVVLALHMLFGALTWHEMRLRLWDEIHHGRRDALQVRLIPRAPAPTPGALPEVAAPPPPQPPPPPRPVVREPPAKNAMTVTLPEPAPAPASSAPPAPDLYDSAGQPLLPSAAATAPAAPSPDYVQRVPRGDSKVMQHDSPVTYKATRFDNDWTPVRGNSSVDDALKRAVDKSTVTHTFHVSPGVRVHCTVVLAALAGGCGVGDGPPKPSGRSGDERLNMAPASSLAPGIARPPAPSIDDCIAIYRANKPLPQGCPVDTPTRAVDAELQGRAPPQGNPDGQ